MSKQAGNATAKLNVKDLITTGIFSALLFLALLIGGIPFGINPVTTFYMPFGSALLGGPILLLLIAKVRKRGAVMIAGILSGIIFIAIGMHWAIGLGCALGGIIGDFIAGIGKFKNMKLNTLAYVLVSLGSTGTFICYFADPQSWNTYMLNGKTSEGYIQTMSANAQGWMLPVILIGTVLIACFSGFVGTKLLKKQFEKAGITA
ncbi:MAG: MptD family putative ECF transporter S component [Anaerotignum sp.]|nr:MptD family putative ECF transporter S component [Anaerotignum sp.]